MIKQLNAVKEFHTAFEIGYSESPKSDLGESKNMLRFNLTTIKTSFCKFNETKQRTKNKNKNKNDSSTIETTTLTLQGERIKH